MTDYTKLFEDMFKPKTDEDRKKVAKLNRLLSEYLIVKFIDDLPKSNVTSFKSKLKKFKSAGEVAGFFKSHIDDFDTKTDKYTQEFLNTYVRI
jgi:hypothetical protein